MSPLPVPPSAPVPLPVPRPPQHRPAAHHRAGDVALGRRHAPSARPAAHGLPGRRAPKRRPAHQDVALFALAGGRPQQSHQGLPRFLGRSPRARLVAPAATIGLARGDPGKSDAWTFLAPNRSISVPNTGWSAGKRLAGGDHHGGKRSKEEHQRAATRVASRRPCRSGRIEAGTVVRSAGHLLLCGWGYPWGYPAAPGLPEWRFSDADGA